MRTEKIMLENNSIQKPGKEFKRISWFPDGHTQRLSMDGITDVLFLPSLYRQMSCQHLRAYNFVPSNTPALLFGRDSESITQSDEFL
ncbi:hypothetical protein CEXT_452021 [Caerostris extrusa]|uniref:Uncharacterized protein n=1 Tax=Caerostris extrusa TaxID=172846 RepID=A0AAV4PB69_CAEEX|nr:hypothetical protein CEXT_452021 [Caerostris extrusa]